MHPVLVPGAHVLLRGEREYQVGLAPGVAAVVGAPPLDPTQLGLAAEALAPLLRAGLAIADDRGLRSVLPPSTEEPWRRHTVAALARRTADPIEQVVRRRDAWAVEVVTFGHPVSRLLAADLAEVCDRGGIRVAAPADRRRVPDPQTVRVLVGVGEPNRDLLDPWLRDGTAHLLVRAIEGVAVVGPFVLPGRTACLRCIDAYLREDDPAWPLLVEQYARATRTDRADGIPEPVDAALAMVAVGWAARDLATYIEGGEPVSASATITLSPLLDAVDTRTWPQHPHCGCAW